MTGYWFLDEDEWTPPRELTDFLDAGPAPVYVGFGSMVAKDEEKTALAIRAALKLAGMRGIVQGDPETSDEHVLAVRDVPHAWLFPRMAAVVHHGGAGTTAAGLRAGVPTVVCPFFGDQPFWGERIAALGAGTAPLPFRSLTAPLLADRIREAVQNDAIVARAGELGTQIRTENGTDHALEVIDSLLVRPRP
jgi:UDP:flavonoid glycosyltransferase YjiC (YdhE family)